MQSCARYCFGIIIAAASFTTSATQLLADASPPSADPLEVNNEWAVTVSNSVRLKAPLYVTLKQVGNHWEIDGLFNEPPQVPITQGLELFMATRDLQQWTNAYVDLRTDCEKFEVRESEFHSVCTSRLAEKKNAIALAGVLFGSGGNVPFAYTDSKVKAAINSIRPQQAMGVLTAFEQGIRSAHKQAEAAATRQDAERHKEEEANIAARKSAPIGAKDWCEQTVQYFGIFMQVERTYTCMNYGVVTEESLRNEGWAIVNKLERKIGRAPQLVTVHDIAIEKAPR